MENRIKVKERAYRGPLITLLALVCVGVAWPQGQGRAPKGSPEPEVISLPEAEILIYLSPRAQEVRKQRGKVGWVLQTGPSENTKDFYTFWIVFPQQAGEASNTVAYFSVNKHTADMWDYVAQIRISGDDQLQDIQRILRDGHHIDPETIDRYQGLVP